MSRYDDRILRAAAAYFVCVVIGASAGCRPPVEDLPPKQPRPVTALEMQVSVPHSSFQVSGVVNSWKTEQIGFEVEGRVQWVLEPGQYASGQMTTVEGKPISKGTPLAQIDPERYQVAVDSAAAALEVAELEQQVAEIRLKESIPADIKSAESDLRLAQSDVDRMSNLRRQNAIAQAELDDASNRVQTQQARLDNLAAQLNQSRLQLASATARVKSAEQELKDTERRLKNTTLYGSYRGQVSEVHVVPGSVVSAGSPVLTLQMMDPIQIEVEVSAEQSRIVQRRRQVPITFVRDGVPVRANAMVYVVDPSADPATRTFTVTLLVLNKQYMPTLPTSVDDDVIRRTEHIWPLNINSIVGVDTSDLLFEEDAVDRDEQGDFVWLVENAQQEQSLPEVLKVRKAYVRLSELRIPFLGNWIFRTGRFVEDFGNPAGKLLVTGPLSMPSGEGNWDGQSVVYDSGMQWMLRPGDLVQLTLGSRSLEAGYYVPVGAVYHDSGETFVFIVDGETAKKTQVDAVLPNSLNGGSDIRISPLGESTFKPGTRIVLEGVHFLKDGDRLSVRRVVKPSPASFADDVEFRPQQQESAQ